MREPTSYIERATTVSRAFRFRSSILLVGSVQVVTQAVVTAIAGGANAELGPVRSAKIVFVYSVAAHGGLIKNKQKRLRGIVYVSVEPTS